MFNPPNYKHLPSTDLFPLSSANIFLLPVLQSLDRSPGYLAWVLPGAPVGSFTVPNGPGELAKPILDPTVCTIFYTL